ADHVAITGNCGANTTVGQGGGPGGIGADVVAQHLIAAAVVDQHAVVAIAGDDIACPGDGAADRVVIAVNLNAVVAVAQGAGAGGIDADGIAQQLIVAAGVLVDPHAVAAIAGDKVAGSRGGAADRVAVGANPHKKAVTVGQGLGTRDVCTDVIAQHLIVGA